MPLKIKSFNPSVDSAKFPAKLGFKEQPLYENLIDRKQLAEKLSISPSYVSKLMTKGMPRVNIGRAVRYRFSEVIAYLDRM